MKRIFFMLIAFALIYTTMIPQNALAKKDDDKKRIRELTKLVEKDNKKSRILWYDLSANLFDLDTPEEVRNIVRKTAKANFDTIVLDIKNSTGYVAYNSEIAPHISTSNIPKYQGYPANYDLLETVIREAKKHKIKVHAAINTFSEASTTYQDGPAMDHPEWQTTYYTAIQKVKAADGASIEITGVNGTRNTNNLILYTPSKYEETPTNRWGVEVQVQEDVITQISDRNTTNGPPVAVPDNGYVLSGNGTARTWMLEHLKVGDRVSVSELETKFVKGQDYTPSASTFVNPIRDDVQRYELSIIEELIDNYDVDGIVLDRARYSNVYADFSDLSRQKFESYIGKRVENWPTDIFEIQMVDYEKTIVPGPLYQKWIEWRAGNIQSFFKKAENLIHKKEPKTFFSTYVGSWYPDYYSEGVNWASRRHHPDYDWASPDYHKKGYAEVLDFIMTGNYFVDVTKEEAIAAGKPDWHSVEGSADIAMDALKYTTFNYGSLYLNQYINDPEQFRRALKMAVDKTHGIMVFDLIYLEMFDWWYIVEEEFRKKSTSPHHIKKYMDLVREDK
ncbi:alpha amylase family protein [Fictibacillus phosphorivorans]|uniref:alpha amylase family protein n=1 Tax=Fictibacillus phosphorivorans TaxID=1221500 RepID=UPI00203E1350|nr:alpha amylase family protein [Fictibacillus phosphorivorans]MCM3718548.1 family 10 glycosylhydrolase [Fictibacillus phosphorivorans]MCM3776096.1 family 10 glycosylhydrolase [Fictibacillus phosphorivorans]